LLRKLRSPLLLEKFYRFIKREKDMSD